jgi:hypothetical protein
MSTQQAGGSLSATPPTNIYETSVSADRNGKTLAAKAKDIKIATSDLFINDTNKRNADEMAYILFEALGAQEMASIVRSDNVNPSLLESEKSAYSPIKNLSEISSRYNPKNIIALQDTDISYFSQFPILFSTYVPRYGNGPGGSIVYVDDNTGDIIIDTIGTTDVQVVEVEIFSIEEVIDDTIYLEE